jgi:hypothetical protein
LEEAMDLSQNRLILELELFISKMMLVGCIDYSASNDGIVSNKNLNISLSVKSGRGIFSSTVT